MCSYVRNSLMFRIRKTLAVDSLQRKKLSVVRKYYIGAPVYEVYEVPVCMPHLMIDMWYISIYY